MFVQSTLYTNSVSLLAVVCIISICFCFCTRTHRQRCDPLDLLSIDVGIYVKTNVIFYGSYFWQQVQHFQYLWSFEFNSYPVCWTVVLSGEDQWFTVKVVMDGDNLVPSHSGSHAARANEFLYGLVRFWLLLLLLLLLLDFECMLCI